MEKLETEDFSLSAYGDLLSTIKKKSIIKDFREAKLAKSDVPTTILRHDIDLCLHKALEIAEFENFNDVKSTFFLMTKNPLYSLENKISQEIIGEIEKLGHFIGLHFDPYVYDDINDEHELEKNVKTEAEFLSKFTSSPVFCLSFHRPSRNHLNGKNSIAGLLNAYSPVYMEFYISDSSRAWRCGPPKDAVNSTSYSIGQVLTHPIWWNVENIPAKDCLDKLSERLKNQEEYMNISISGAIRDLVPKVHY